MKKNILNILCSFVILFSFASCDENEELPGFETIGTATATDADITVSNDEPASGEEITLSLYYINVGSDPAREIEVLVSIDGGDFTSFTTLDESSATVNAEITRTVDYTVADGLASGTSIRFDMLLKSAKEFPQREIVTVTVQ